MVLVGLIVAVLSVTLDLFASLVFVALGLFMIVVWTVLPLSRAVYSLDRRAVAIAGSPDAATSALRRLAEFTHVPRLGKRLKAIEEV